MEHRLGIPSSVKPIIQKRRSFNVEKQDILRKEITDLLQADAIRRIQFLQWFANLMVVAKLGDKWRVCIDFTSLNRAIPKKSYPLSRTELLANTTAWYSLLSFLHTHKGYHQIQMAVEDEEKITFFTLEGLFCYKRMPFSLKNAGANFHDINRMFASQLGCNVEAYFDDIFVKTKTSLGIV